jgi:hypothetical protein
MLAVEGRVVNLKLHLERQIKVAALGLGDGVLRVADIKPPQLGIKALPTQSQ